MIFPEKEEEGIAYGGAFSVKENDAVLHSIAAFWLVKVAIRFWRDRRWD